MIREVQMGKNKTLPTCCGFHVHVVYFPAGCQVLYASCCFLPSRSPAMGNLIKVLGKDLENCPHFFLDFESK